MGDYLSNWLHVVVGSWSSFYGEYQSKKRVAGIINAIMGLFFKIGLAWVELFRATLTRSSILMVLSSPKFLFTNGDPMVNDLDSDWIGSSSNVDYE